MAYKPTRWLKIVVLIPAVAIVVMFVCAAVVTFFERYENLASTALAREAMSACAAEHNVQPAWRAHPTMTTFDAEVMYFSARTEGEVAAANCIIDRTPEMSFRSGQPIECLNDEAEVELKRIISGQIYVPSEENYAFELSPCSAAAEDTET